jgi:hypothetical protein
MNLKLVLGVLFVGLAANSARASQIEVMARLYDTNHCQYYWTTSADFQFSYPANQLAQGSKVNVHYAFHDSISQLFWQSPNSAPATYDVSSGNFVANLNQVIVATRGTNYFNAIEYYFEIVSPNGSVFDDNGGQGAMGHYASSLTKSYAGQMSSECTPGIFQNLSVNHFGVNDSGESAL